MLPLSPDSFYFREGAPDFSKTIIDVPFKDFSRRSRDLQSPESYDFPSNLPFDYEKTSTRGHLTDDALAKVASLDSLRDHRFPLASLRCTQSQEILPSQTCQRLAEAEDLRGCTLSRAKFPNLEGRASSQISPTPGTPSGFPLLKRKAKFTSSPGTLRLRNQQGPACHGGTCSRCSLTAHSSCYSRQEFTPSNDWTLEHVMPRTLQARVDVPFAPLPAPQTIRPLPSPTSSYSEEESLLRNPGYPAFGNKEQVKPIVSQTSIWQNFVGGNDKTRFTMGSTEARSGWPLESSFYGPKHVSYTAPGLVGTTEEFSDNGLMVQDYLYYEAMNDESIDDYFLEPTRQFHPTEPETFSPTFPPATQTYSSSPNSSLCPSIPAVFKSSSKHRKSGRRKSSVGMLRSNNPFGFVNYTPGDSEKILAGVAPSGSSKTKARREQEAYEKKRKLSLAAEKVIKEAGGDVEQLRASGLLM